VLLVISIYMSFVYALLYMLMAALPLIYHEIRGLSPVVANLPLISVFVGILFGGGIIILDMYRYARVCRDRPEAAVPEQRFFPMGLGALLLRKYSHPRHFCFGLPRQQWACSGLRSPVPPRCHRLGRQLSPWRSRCAAWSSSSSAASSTSSTVSWACTAFSGDGADAFPVYKSFANSAIAANTIMRSLVGATFPLFTPAMVRNLGYSVSLADASGRVRADRQSTWSMVLVAGIAVVLAPIPVVFYRLGAGLRARSRFSAEL